MESSKGLPKGLEFLGCLNVTLVLRDFQVLTGRIKGFVGDRDMTDGLYADYDDNHHKKCDCQKDDHHDDKCCKPPKLDVKVEVDEDNRFILLELTRPAAAANLSSVICELVLGTVALTVSGTTFPAGTCVAVNVENILYAGTAPEFCDIPVIISTNGASGLNVELKK